MKTIRLLFVLGFILTVFSCDKDDDVELSSFDVVKETITPSYTTADIVCEFSTRATVKNVFVHYSKNADFSNYEELGMVEKNGKFSASLSALQRNTTYYIRYAAKNSYSSAVTKKVSQAKTLDATAATVTTTAATDVSYTTATVGGEVTFDGYASVTERGVCYSTSQNPTISNSKISSGSGTGSFSVSLTGLSVGTTYYARAYAINSKGTSYGEQVSFTTNTITLPIVITTAATNVFYTTATVGGEVTFDGYASVTERGVCYSTSQNPTTSSNKISSGSSTGSFSVSLTGLSDGTTYYVRAYAINSKGTSYGEQVSFTTSPNASKYVDLGLSVKWATCNVGATKPEEYGNYYAWGETEPKTSCKWATYKWCNGSESTLTKYNTSSSYGTVDNKTVLDLADDAARVNWGGAWRMPTDAEWTELRENCTWTRTSDYNGTGAKGRIVTSKINGNHIFLPAAGFRGNDDSIPAGSVYGLYWSSSLNTYYSGSAWYVYFGSDDVYRGRSSRCDGQSVRPVLVE